MIFDRYKYAPRALVWIYSLIRKGPVFESDTQMDGLHKLVDTANPTEVSELEFVERMARPNKTIENIKLAIKVWTLLHLTRVVYCW
jgi:hypothetical protein